jgi:hypothetical protein
MGHTLIVKCPYICGQWLTVVYERGYPDSMAGPGEPDMWISTNDEVIVHGVYVCSHEGGLSRQDWEEFQWRCSMIDDESFEDDSLNRQDVLYDEGYAKEWEEENGCRCIMCDRCSGGYHTTCLVGCDPGYAALLAKGREV